MARFTTNLTVATQKETTSAQLSGDYTDVFSLNQTVNDSGVGHLILSNDSDIGSLTLNDCKTLLIKNSGAVGVELIFLVNAYTSHATDPDVDASAIYFTSLLASGEFLMLPNIRLVGLSSLLSAADSDVLNNQVPDSNMYTSSGAITTEGFADDNDTTITFDDGSGGSASGFFEVGDLIRLDDEVCRVVSFTSTVFTVERAVYGTAKADHTNNTVIRFPFFNAYADFDKYTTVQTDASGRFKCFNFMGFGRIITAASQGIVPGSVAGKFYTAGYQELGMSGITASTESGLTAGDYKIDITVDGGTLFQDLTFTVGSNTKFGGSDGVLRKIQDAFDVQYYTAGHLFEKRVTVSIVNGDIRFTSGQRLSTSAILLADTGDAGSFLDAAANGRIPIAGDIEAPVPAKLPDDALYDKKTNISTPNIVEMFYDDGKGNITGVCSGTINYQSGAIEIYGAPPNSNFVVSAYYNSAHSGGNRYSGGDANSIQQIKARSTNPKINTTIELIALK
tara:strand:+ start:836 stop:2353 length:1518 start_codon:yes stop_codon:yes gene_type:complete